MATLVFFHAHPDDEAITTAGTMARAADGGHRTVVVFATRGELGEHDPSLLDAGETLGERREREARAAGEVLGAGRVEFLGYRDSGMIGEPSNDDERCFWRADPEEAAGRLARILEEERADVLTTYDDHGGYGHPDHIQVHRVGVRAAELAGVDRVYESTINRDEMRALMEMSASLDVGEGELPDAEELATWGTPDAEITTAVDVAPWAQRKRAAMAAHASQIDESAFFLRLAPEEFLRAFGCEWYVRRGVAPGPRETWLLDGEG